MRGRTAIALGILLVAALPAAAAASNFDDCQTVSDGGTIAFWDGDPILRGPGVMFGNNSSGGPIRIARLCIVSQPDPPRVSPQPPPPLSIIGAYAFWTGPGEVGVSWETNIASTGRVAWGVEPARFIGFTDFATPEGLHGARISGAPRDQPLHISIQAVSAAGEIVRMDIQGPSPQLAPAPPAAADWPAAVVSSVAALGAVLVARRALARRK